MVRKTDTINYIAVGLLMDQILPEHKTGVPTILTVLSGAIEFCIEDKEYLLYPFDIAIAFQLDSYIFLFI